MSVSISIENPISSEEDEFYFPLATESFFYNVWVKGAIALNLKLIPFLGNGFEINKEEWVVLKQEIKQIILWANDNLDSKIRDELCVRANLVMDNLDCIFKRDDAIVSFG
ncbi:MAG TPA: hypothetical protein V6D15_08905 [Oculatellaceae cyanobacterium]|jgi:hypothetical protein